MARTRSRRAILKDLKRGGKSRADVWAMVNGNVRDTAAKEGWRKSELAYTLADWQRDIDAVFGPKGD